MSEKVALATEMQYYHNQFCQFGLGYEFKLRSATFKGLVQSDTTCSAVLEEHVSPGINLVLSGQVRACMRARRRRRSPAMECGTLRGADTLGFALPLSLTDPFSRAPAAQPQKEGLQIRRRAQHRGRVSEPLLLLLLLLSLRCAWRVLPSE